MIIIHRGGRRCVGAPWAGTLQPCARRPMASHQTPRRATTRLSIPRRTTPHHAPTTPPTAPRPTAPYTAPHRAPHRTAPHHSTYSHIDFSNLQDNQVSAGKCTPSTILSSRALIYLNL